MLGRNASILLDVVRFGAALAVALTHIRRYATVDVFISERSGNAAVCVFFVLSGFVIRYVTLTRETTAREYGIDRASRIYSVVIPALVLTLLLEGAACLHAPHLYRHFSDPFPWSVVPTEMVQNLTFTVGWWGWGSTPLSNGPFWSLSFECVYYALYGVLQFAPRARWFLVPLMLFAVGPSIALLFPIWLLGAALYDVYAWLHLKRLGVPTAAGVAVAFVGVLLAFRHPVLRILEATTVEQRTAAITRMMNEVWWGRALFHGATLHWLDRFSVSYFVTGSLLAVLMLPTLLALDRYVPAASREWAKKIRLVADSTFTLYLFHLPFFILVATMAGGELKTWKSAGLMLGAAVILSILLAAVFDRLKNALRAGMRGSRSPRPNARNVSLAAAKDGSSK